MQLKEIRRKGGTANTKKIREKEHPARWKWRESKDSRIIERVWLHSGLDQEIYDAKSGVIREVVY